MLYRVLTVQLNLRFLNTEMTIAARVPA